MIANLLDGIEIRLNTDYLENKAELDALADKVVYTGPIDAYFDYKLGTLEYRSVRFETETLPFSPGTFLLFLSLLFLFSFISFPLSLSLLFFYLSPLNFFS